MPFVYRRNRFFHIGPQLIKVPDFCPVFGAIKRNTGRHRLYGKVCVSVAIHYNRVSLILARDVPLNGVRVLDRGQTDEVRQFGIKFVQHLDNPIQIKIMQIGIWCSVNRFDIHN